jgi:hypothetical protein
MQTMDVMMDSVDRHHNGCSGRCENECSCRRDNEYDAVCSCAIYLYVRMNRTVLKLRTMSHPLGIVSRVWMTPL